MAEPVKVYILDKEYLVACPPDQKEGLLRSARYLDKRMQEIRASGKVIGLDRIAVMAALNIAHELLSGQHDDRALEEVRERLQALDNKLAHAVGE